MIIRTPVDLGAAIKERRKDLGLGQAELANRIGTSRRWLIEVEHGHPRAELGLALRALDELGIRLASRVVSSSPNKQIGPDIDAIISEAKKRTT